MAPPPPSLSRRLFWRTKRHGHVIWERSDRPFVGFEARLPADSDPVTVERLRAHNKSLWIEYALELDGPHVIEPNCGWAVRGVRTLVERSLVEGVKCIPAPSRYLAKRALFAHRARRESSVVSLRTAYETNYWHLFDDVFPRLALLDSLGVDAATPIVVARALWEKPYFQGLVARGPLQRRTWLVQDPGRFVRSDRTYVSKTFPPDRERFEQILRLLAVEPAAAGDGGRERRLFVVRDDRFGRVLRNGRELERIAANAGFEQVEPAALRIEEQIALFGGARRVVGIHGAGLGNTLFRAGRPLDVLELFSPTWYGPQYFWLACAFGYGYRGLFGESDGAGYDFVVPPEAFERELERICAG